MWVRFPLESPTNITIKNKNYEVDYQRTNLSFNFKLFNHTNNK